MSRAKNTCHNTTAAVSRACKHQAAGAAAAVAAADDSENGKRDRKDSVKKWREDQGEKGRKRKCRKEQMLMKKRVSSIAAGRWLQRPLMGH